ncbi:MAG: transposase [Novosphingobium sp.]|uniref:transposase n=1 Tax=Novosphingobium sp. TaxID=1874826 RepID=UPI001D6C5BDB|nr:transposase [Novosphingobium sp.]MCB2058110.1 transposase [Novosphingobium sp.]MCP5385550.1 transposase [Novosphingobium sp.]
MPRVIDCKDTARASLAETADALRGSGFDPRDEESLEHAALWLRRLGNDESFLGDMLIESLAQRHREDVLENSYGPQVMMLVPPCGQFFIRANIWPSLGEHMVRASGGPSFALGLPHDHNFSFLTLGYFGPGYWSDYYEFDYDEVAGARGESVESLRFVERSRLEQGKLMLYRAHVDVHAQGAADSLSVSLNVMHTNGAQGWFDQYRFDLERREIGAIVSPGPSDAFLKLAVALGSAEGLDLAHRFARRHPSDRLRLAAWDALAARECDAAARDALWREAEGSGSRLVTLEAKARRAELVSA